MDDLLAGLSVRDRIAQLVIPWIPGTYAAYDAEAFARMQMWVDSLHVGGLIVSVGSPLDIAAKLNRLQEHSPLPLLIASDLEGGTSIRFNGGTPLPPNMGVAATGSDSMAPTRWGASPRSRAAPSASTSRSHRSPTSTTTPPTRSSTSAPTAKTPPPWPGMVAAEVRGLQEHGMLATAKHFPGHGDTGTDSHLALPVITADWRRLDSVELVPVPQRDRRPGWKS